MKGLNRIASLILLIVFFSTTPLAFGHQFSLKQSMREDENK